MPSGDGTGPWGFGPGTGRGRLGCRGAGRRQLFRPGLPTGRRWQAGIVAPLLIAAFRDLTNPSGFLRRLLSLANTRKGNQPRPRVVRDADYDTIDEKQNSSKRVENYDT